MLLMIVFLMCVFVAVGTSVLAALSDLRGMVIPNSYSVIIIVAFVVCFGAMWFSGRDDIFSSIWSHGLSALIMFLVTLAMFGFKLIGAGDSKFGTALALWVGLKGLMPFVFYMSLVGGLLAIAALVLKKWKPLQHPKEGGWVAQVQSGASKVPYGCGDCNWGTGIFCENRVL